MFNISFYTEMHVTEDIKNRCYICECVLGIIYTQVFICIAGTKEHIANLCDECGSETKCQTT